MTAATIRLGSDAPHLRRVRWAVRAALALGVAASVVANVLHAEPTVVGRAIAAWPPLALLLTIELITRVPVHHPALARVRWIATAAISGIAAWVSYWHMVDVAVRYGETAASAHLIPLSVDGLVIVASVCLVELAGRIRQTEADAAPIAAALGSATEPQGVAPVPAADMAAPPIPSHREPVAVVSAARRTRASRRDRAGTRPDAALIAALAEVPREADGTVPVRRAAAALGCGFDRARRLLADQGLLRTAAPTASPAVAAEVAA